MAEHGRLFHDAVDQVQRTKMHINLQLVLRYMYSKTEVLEHGLC